MIDAGVVRHHQPTHFVGRLYVRAFFAEGHLDGSWAPVDEIGHFVLPNPL